MERAEPELLIADVMHQRLWPKKNGFHYKVYYLSLPLTWLESQPIDSPLSLNRWGVHAFYLRDHGYRDERSLRAWVYDLLGRYHQPLWQDITLITMPRVLGYVFNPVSFWVCRNEQQEIKAVIYEVNNTFGETHTYVSLPDEGRCVDATLTIHAEKCFHVSPFLPRQGSYAFCFDSTKQQLQAHIDYFGAEGQKVLITKLWGKWRPLTASTLRATFWKCPLVTLKAIVLIHYQALKLFLKKVTFHKKPIQKAQKDSCSGSR